MKNIQEQAALIDQPDHSMQAQPELRLSQRIANSRIGRLGAALLATVSAGVAAEMFTSSPALASVDTPWTHYGGDPMWPGGTPSELSFQDHVASTRDAKSMTEMGIPAAGIRAIRRSSEEGDIKLVHHPFGTVVDKMTYDTSVQIEDNAKFEDPRYESGFNAWETTGTVSTTKKITERVHGKIETGTETTTYYWTFGEPTICGNGSLYKVGERTRYNLHPAQKHHNHKRHHSSTNEKVFIYKEALDDTGRLLPETPTNTFHFEVEAKEPNGKQLDKLVTIDYNPQYVGTYPDGTRITSIEEATTGPDQWEDLTSPVQKFTLAKGEKDLTIVAKDEELMPPPPTQSVCANIPGSTSIPSGDYRSSNGDCYPIPTPPSPTPVTISISNLTTAEALYPNSSEQLCVNVSASDGSIPSLTWSIDQNQGNGEGSISSTGFEDQDGNPQHECDTFYNGSDVGQTYINVEATDGNATPATTQFDIATQQDSGF